MSEFVILYGLMALMILAAIVLIVPTLLRRPESDEESARTAAEYGERLRDALADERRRLDEDLAAGRVTQELHASLLEDLARRAIEEAKLAAPGGDPLADDVKKTASAPKYAAGVIALVVGLSIGFYSILGAPELMRLSEDQRVLEGTASLESIETYLKDNARDGRAWVLLARRRAEASDFQGAADAYRRGREVNSKIAADPTVMLEFGAALLTAGNPAGFPEAKAVLVKALEADPQNPQAIELVAIAALQTNDLPLALEQIRAMMNHISPDRPEYLRYEATARELERRIAESEKQEGKAAPSRQDHALP